MTPRLYLWFGTSQIYWTIYKWGQPTTTTLNFDSSSPDNTPETRRSSTSNDHTWDDDPTSFTKFPRLESFREPPNPSSILQPDRGLVFGTSVKVLSDPRPWCLFHLLLSIDPRLLRVDPLPHSLGRCNIDDPRTGTLQLKDPNLEWNWWRITT